METNQEIKGGSWEEQCMAARKLNDIFRSEIAQLKGTCKECRYYGAGKYRFDVCSHEKMVSNCQSPASDGLCGIGGQHYVPPATGPDFGCVHFQPTDSEAEKERKAKIPAATCGKCGDEMEFVRFRWHGVEQSLVFCCMNKNCENHGLYSNR